MSTRASRPVGLRDREHRVVALSVLGLMTFIAFESFAVTTALPVVATDLRAEQWYPLAYAATLTTALVGMTIGGSWADRRGVSMPLAVGGSLFLAGLALCALAPTMQVFIAGRLLQGIGGGIDSVVIYVVIAQLLPEHLRTRMFGLLTAAWLLPGIAGPLITGLVVDLVGWRLVFIVVLVGACTSLAALLTAVRGAHPTGGTTAIIGKRGAWASVAALGVLVLHYAGQQSPVLLTAGTGVAVIAIVAAASRLLPRGTLRLRAGVPRLTGLRGLLGATVAATDIYLPLYLQRQLEYTPTRAGSVVAIGALGWVLGAWVQSRSRAAVGDPRILFRATALVLLGPVTASLFVSGLITIHSAVAGCVLMGLGMGLAYPQITAAVLSHSKESEQGTHSSGLQLAESMSQSIAIAATGAVLTIGVAHNYGIVYALISGIGAAALATAVALLRQGQPTPQAMSDRCV